MLARCDTPLIVLVKILEEVDRSAAFVLPIARDARGLLDGSIRKKIHGVENMFVGEVRVEQPDSGSYAPCKRGESGRATFFRRF
jgi:hypothetical protein